MWACHNEREEDQRGSPRESRVTVSPCSRVVNKGPRTVDPLQNSPSRRRFRRPSIQRMLPF